MVLQFLQETLLQSGFEFLQELLIGLRSTSNTPKSVITTKVVEKNLSAPRFFSPDLSVFVNRMHK